MSKRVRFLLEIVIGETDNVYNVADSLLGEARHISASSAGQAVGLAQILASSEPPRTQWDYSKEMYRWDSKDG